METNIKMNQMVDLKLNPGKDLKLAIVKMILQTTINFLEIFEKIEKLSKEIFFLKEPSRNYRTKDTISKIKNALNVGSGVK